MKTKLNFKVGAFTIERNNVRTDIPQINFEIENETTIQEIEGLYEVQKKTLKELPKLLEQILPDLESLCEKLIQSPVKETEHPDDIKRQIEKEEIERIQHESLNEWFEDFYTDEKSNELFTKLFTDYCKKINIKFNNILYTFYQMDLEHKMAFYNIVITRLPEFQ